MLPQQLQAVEQRSERRLPAQERGGRRGQCAERRVQLRIREEQRPRSTARITYGILVNSRRSLCNMYLLVGQEDRPRGHGRDGGAEGEPRPVGFAPLA